ncbi:MAG TPA: hypothetical protein VM344_08865 [Vitreimonas sp.]|nr:hypothetical protein [Vitreimonas sp.]
MLPTLSLRAVIRAIRAAHHRRSGPAAEPPLAHRHLALPSADVDLVLVQSVDRAGGAPIAGPAGGRSPGADEARPLWVRRMESWTASPDVEVGAPFGDDVDPAPGVLTAD